MWNNVIGPVTELTKDEIIQEVSALCPKYTCKTGAIIIGVAIYDIIQTDPEFFSDFRMIVADENDLAEEGEGFISIYNDCFMDEIRIDVAKAQEKRKSEIVKEALLSLM